MVDITNSDKKADQSITRPIAAKAAEIMAARNIEPMSVVPWVIQLRVVGTLHTVNVSVGDFTIVIGRSRKNAPVIPDIDLGPFGALEKGVSREHAAITSENDHLMIYDLGSNNGTYLNEKLLPPRVKFPLKNGDTLAFGELQMQVRFNVLPAKATNQDLRVGAGKNILVVEDDSDVAFAYRMMFEHHNYKVTVIDDLAVLTKSLVSVKPDIVICDLILSNAMSGAMDIVHIIRSMLGNEVPLLVVSGMTAGHKRQEAIASGANDFMGKPIRMDHLMERIDQLIHDTDKVKD